MGRAPKAVVLFGVEPAVIELGMELSPLVKATVAPLCEQVLEELRGLGQAVSPRAPLAAGAA
jgi:Ni,Fe-hydrogenase maturation factor